MGLISLPCACGPVDRELGPWMSKASGQQRIDYLGRSTTGEVSLLAHIPPRPAGMAHRFASIARVALAAQRPGPSVRRNKKARAMIVQSASNWAPSSQLDSPSRETRPEMGKVVKAVCETTPWFQSRDMLAGGNSSNKHLYGAEVHVESPMAGSKHLQPSFVVILRSAADTKHCNRLTLL